MVHYIFHGLLIDSMQYLLSVSGAVAQPLAEARAPVLEHVGLGELLALAVAEAALRAHGRHHVHARQVHLDPLARLRRGLRLRAPRAARQLLVQPANTRPNLYSWCTTAHVT